MPSTAPDLLQTPLYDLHLELGARMVPFAGYSMPVQYPAGLMAEHKHTRTAAGLFDISHMGQINLVGADAAAALESLIPADVLSLEVNKQRYGLQGPQACAVLQRVLPGVEKLVFMTGNTFLWGDAEVCITRSGYTGEDGFEISIHSRYAQAFARELLKHAEVQPIGLGARNSLRLEAGLCLYGNDIDATTTPIEAGLGWAIPKVRRSGGARAGGFPAADKILAQIDGSLALTRKRVALIAQERVPVREPAELQSTNGERIGAVTSGLLAPNLDQAIALAYVDPAYAAVGTVVNAIVRGKAVPMLVSATPFVPTRYYRG